MIANKWEVKKNATKDTEKQFTAKHKRTNCASFKPDEKNFLKEFNTSSSE